jgi:hypothetical protein
VQVIADPAGRLVWIWPALPGARHDLAAAREHGIIDAVTAAGVRAVADPAYQGSGPAVAVPQRRRRLDPRHRPIPAALGGAEGGQHRARPNARARCAGQLPAEELEDTAEDPLQPQARPRSSTQSRP